MLIGLALMGAGFYLLSTFDVHTTNQQVIEAMVLIGLGLGLTMQTYTLVVQNAVDRIDMAVATSATQLSRSMGAAIGLAIAVESHEFESALLRTIQRDLFTIGAELATPDPAKMGKALARSGAAVGPSDIGALEDVIDGYETKLPPLKNFILPGGTRKAAMFHVARTVCRRAERNVVALSREQAINRFIVHYLNRLSDLLFVLARASEP